MVEVKVKVFANLRDLVPVKPGIAEPIIMDVKSGSTILDIMTSLNLTTEDVAIIFIGGIHHKPDHIITEPTSMSLFSPSGGG